ncbi:hypothetical protein J2T20_002803 [Paenibacillus wynnii]|nr:hypothetical protein [Paenibacillus wynnii]
MYAINEFLGSLYRGREQERDDFNRLCTGSCGLGSEGSVVRPAIMPLSTMTATADCAQVAQI